MATRRQLAGAGSDWASIKPLLLNVIDRRQALVLAALNSGVYYSSLTAAIKKISSKYSIPESTLRNHAKRLREWKLIDADAVKPTKGGELVLNLISRHHSYSAF